MKRDHLRRTLTRKKKKKSSALLWVITALLWIIPISWIFALLALNTNINRINDQPSLEAGYGGATPTLTPNRGGGNEAYKACTPDQRSKIMTQLLPNQCNNQGIAYRQKCSITKATKCPQSTWYDSNFDFLRRRLKKEQASFVGVYVGCNKGYDAVNTLRLGTGKKKYSKNEWSGQMTDAHHGVCNQDKLPDFALDEESVVVDGIVHCIEPMPITAEALRNSAKNLGWDDELVVKETAMSNTNGVVYFPNSNDKGIENKGIGNCQNEQSKQHCKEVPVITLDNYMENEAVKKDAGRIHLLSIDVEGFDFDVMKGGTRTLARTEYLEFEYNWMGSWGQQHLIDAIKMLDDLGFTCYWAGEDRLWRLDESCWLDHYDYHTWSNVACVNRKLNREVAMNMEKTFYKTLEEKDVSYGD